SSQVRYVPQGVKPLAQLFSVPRTTVPFGSALVFIRAWPEAGPLIRIGVLPVMRRLYFELRTISHLLRCWRMWITEAPCAFCAFSTLSAVHGSMNSAPNR